MTSAALDRHALAWVGIAGAILDGLGGLYLAYDLLGGVHGPLRTLTRAVTYGLWFGLVWVVVFGPAFALVAGHRMDGRVQPRRTVHRDDQKAV